VDSGYGLDLHELARAAAATSWVDAPGPVRDRVVELVSDVVATTALGSGRSELRVLATTFGLLTPDGPATVVGSARGWPAATAAFLNGCAVAADQLQDGHRPARGHPGAHAVPAVLALAEEAGSSGAEVLSAVLAGYEVGTRIGMMMGGTPTGVHDIGTWGQMAAAVATARLLAPLDVLAMHRAIELSAAAVLLTDAGTVFAGETGSHAFLGLSVQHGLTIGVSAVAGLQARPAALSRHLMSVAALAPTPVAAGIIDGRWVRWQVLEGYFKRYPTCAHLHGVNEAVDELVHRGVGADGIERIEVEVFAGAVQFGTAARTELAARFSIPTSVAVGLLTGRLDESTMTTAQVTSDEIMALGERVSVRHDPALDAGYPDGRPARVTVVHADGTRTVATAGRPRWDGDRRPGPAELAGKRDRLFQRRFGAAGAHAVGAALEALPAARNIAELSAALRRSAEMES
jgi:2-methylcitrate dehydratase PrpD